ncbi:MAG TPA: SGNH/GDSL hydrolase family protein [Candidatus Limnocylindria bacterium]|jgi:hypothetical protein|nr:SGNH/GDSL hydrolase family protein [Candidatus Limnocylindria bacterium]
MPSLRASFLCLPLIVLTTCADQALQTYLAFFPLRPAPAAPAKPVLVAGDRLAICGDSITEQKLYSRIIETYLTVCTPELNISVRQYGWSGETADGFLHRMTNDVLRFNPTVATTCYGMNDHRYVPYKPEIGDFYRKTMSGVVESFQSHGVRVVLGSPGSVGKMPSWVKSATGTVTDLNINLCTLRNIDIDLASSLHTASYADVFAPMVTSEFVGRQYYGADYAVPGKDGVHPGMAGQGIMAYAYLHSLGLTGDLGTITVNLSNSKASATAGHKILSSSVGRATIESSKYPFIATGALEDDGALRSGFQWVPFQQELNRLKLVVSDAGNRSYRVTWGTSSTVYPGSALKAGVNLAADFSVTPFDAAFAKVDAAVAAKQAYETSQIKGEFHGAAGKKDMEGTVKATEAVRAPLVAAIKTAFTPVTHTLTVTPE